MKKPENPEPTPDATPSAARPLRLAAAGFLAGALLAVGVGLLFQRSRQNAEAPSPAEPPATVEGHAQSEPPTADSPADRLAVELATRPDDLGVRKELARAYLDEKRFLEAFDQSTAILERSPEDAAALYVQAVVRVRMGQSQRAVGLLERAVAADPHHAPAYFLRGTIQLRSGDMEGAVATWQRGLDMAGGDDQGLEHMLDLARQGKLDPSAAGPLAAGATETPGT